MSKPKPKTMTLRIDAERAEALAVLIGHVGGGTTSKAIWQAIRNYPAQAEALRVEREALVELRGKMDRQATAFADLRRWADKAAGLMLSVVYGRCAD